jgi:hypothetical protein
MNGIDKLWSELDEDKKVEILVDAFSEDKCPSHLGLRDPLYAIEDEESQWCVNECEKCDECFRIALRQDDYEE